MSQPFIRYEYVFESNRFSMSSVLSNNKFKLAQSKSLINVGVHTPRHPLNGYTSHFVYLKLVNIVNWLYIDLSV